MHNRDFDRLSSDYIKLKDKYDVLSQKVFSLQAAIKNKTEAFIRLKSKFEAQLVEKDGSLNISVGSNVETHP